MSKQLFTHALDIAGAQIPKGYVPVGTQESLNNLYENLKTQGQVFETLSLYSLKSGPPVKKPELTREFLSAKARQLIEEGGEVRIAPAEIKKKVENVKGSAKVITSGLKKIMDKAKGEGKSPSVTDLLPLALAAQKLTTTSTETYKVLRDGVEKTLYHQADENVVVNENGVFVSEKWLSDPQNAALQSVFKIQRTPEPSGPGE